MSPGLYAIISLLPPACFNTTLTATPSMYGSRDLLPELPLNSIVVMDNAAFHKRPDIQQTIQQAGHTLAYWPPYSPHLNPVEHKWAQAKALRRKLRCDVDTLFTSHFY